MPDRVPLLLWVL